MSKGHGRVERAILAAVNASPFDKGLPMSQLVTAVYGADKSTRSQGVSVRRAVGRLEDQELVATWRDPAYPTPGRHYWRRTGRTTPCQGESCGYCEAGHPSHGSATDPWHEEYGQVRDVAEKWVQRHPATWSAEEVVALEDQRAHALKMTAALERAAR